jgi:hypothetical protein
LPSNGADRLPSNGADRLPSNGADRLPSNGGVMIMPLFIIARRRGNPKQTKLVAHPTEQYSILQFDKVVIYKV